MKYSDRREAGKQLVEKLIRFKNEPVVVYAVPRGGVVVANEVSSVLKCELDLIVTRKVGHPQNQEYAVCVVAEDGHEMCNEAEVATINSEWLQKEKKIQIEEAKRRRQVYWGNRPRPSVAGRVAIVVDDGVATGMSMLASLQEVRELKPRKVVVAVPVMPADFLGVLTKECDEVICPLVDPMYRGSVGAYYDEFLQVTDAEVGDILGTKNPPNAG